jgi:hypothetical protein
MTPRAYTRLPGRGRTWRGLCRVWLGEDHLLMVQTANYGETYKRFFFKDIQAIVVQRTHMGKTWNAIWGGLFLFFGILAAVGGEFVTSIVLLCIGAPFGLALLVNLILGPMCVLSIRTAVQTERVSALRRMRTAEQFIARIEPLIVAAQGELPPETLDEVIPGPATVAEVAPGSSS